MIFSEGKDLPGNIMLEQAFRAEVLKQSKDPIEFYPEHMDASHFSNKALYQIFRDYLAAKYSDEPLDLLMIFLGRDFRLAEDLPPDIFPKVPAVFVIATELEVPPAVLKRRMSGIIQRHDPRATIALVRTLQPETDRIVVVAGTSEADLKTLSKIEEIGRNMRDVEFEFWTNRPIKELLRPASELPKNSVILLSTILSDAGGQTYYMSRAAELLAPAANAPIYALGGSAIGRGALGGAVVDPAAVGTDAAHLALKTLESKGGAAPEVILRSNVTVIVDWRELGRWGIKESRLPPGCEAHFRPRSLWQEHKVFITATLGVFFAQAVTIAALVVQRGRRQRAEAEIQRQRTELAHVARVSTMGHLASALAHEINQPLGAILRNAEAAELFLQREKPDLDELRAIVSDIRKDDQRAGGVIDRMRSLLQRRSLESSPLDVRELLEETVAIARPDARARSVRLSLELPARLPAVRGDRVHLQQVLLNLILNAMDAMAAGDNGERSVVVRATELQDGEVEVQVRDFGTGVPADKIGRVFEPFFTTKPTGMGMGLAISRTIIEAHGGTIRVENNPNNRGATFIFTLPQGLG
jgi:signal transduction histidine kinase